MATNQATGGELRVENLGGIDETALAFQPGVTVLAGRNATNRTSVLRAIMAAFGSDRGSLKADADSGRVELTYDGETYTRTFERRNGNVVMGGNPYLDDPADVEVADLFAFLLESNEARRGVVTDADLREVIMRPVDTAAIEQEIERTLRERDRLDDELDELDDFANRLPSLEERRQSLQADLASVETELEEAREALAAAEESAAEKGDDDDAMVELEAAREEFNRTRRRLDTERQSVDSLETELEELREERDSMAEPEELDGVEDRLDQLRSRQSRLDDAVSQLQSILELNRTLLEEDDDPVGELFDSGDSDSVDALLPESEQETVCWTCGSTVERDEIEDAVDRLESVREDMLSERGTVRAEIDELTDKRREHRERRNELERIGRRIERAESELEERRERIEELESDREELEAAIEELEDEVAAAEDEERDEVLELNREINELEFERDSLESDLEEVETEIEDIESRLDDRETLEADREAATDRLQELRGRIDRIEESAVESFNGHMAEVLDVLDYGNLERVWIDHRAAADPSEFDLKIVRSAPDGSVYEDSVDHLSESEREVTGLVFALAGYLVHDAHETVPVMLLDSIEAVDSERIADLLEYFTDYADTLVVALLPSDADAVSDDYHYVREI